MLLTGTRITGGLPCKVSFIVPLLTEETRGMSLTTPVSAAAPPARVLWVTLDFPPRLSSGVFRPIKIYKYVDKHRLSIDFITHGRAARFENSVVDESLLTELNPPTRVVRVPTPVPHDMLPALAGRLKRLLRRSHGRGAAPTPGHIPPAAVPTSSAPAAARRIGMVGTIYRWLAMCLYFPDHLFLWGHLATWTALAMHLRRRYDVIYTTSYPESAHLPGVLLHALGVPWVADYRYGGPLWVKKLVGFDKPNVRQRLDLWFQRMVMRRADRVITQSDPMRADFSRIFGIDPAKIDVIPSGYDDEDFTRPRDQEPPLARDGSAVHMLHVGVMEGTTSHDRAALARALGAVDAELRQSGRRLVLHAVGKHIFDEAVRDTLRFEYLHHGTIVHRDLPPYLLSADCYLLSTFTTSTGHDGVRGFIPGKLWEYLRAGKTIVMVGPKDASWSIIDEAGVGLHMAIDQPRPLPPGALQQALDGPRPLHWKVPSYSWQARALSLQRVFLQLTGAASDTPHKGQAHA
jgi:glycosyltransferase involved in cell wall biosynthesis